MVSVRLEGGLANQIWMTAFLIAYSKKHGLDYCIPKEVNNPHIAGKMAYEFSGVNYCDTIPNLTPYHEKYFHYEQLPKMDNVIFHGYWQSWKYLQGFRHEILKAFNLNWKFNEGVCSIHVRRTDYLKWPDHHPVITEDYIASAVKYVYEKTKGKIKFRFYSDDLEYCRFISEKLFWFYPKLVEYSDGNDEIKDLEDASSCEHNIGSNSAYSFWIHYLNQNPNKIAVFPLKSKWFGKALPHNVDDLYMHNWVTI